VTAVVVALGVVVALLGVLVVGLLRSHAEVLRALHELGVGEDQLHGATPAARRAAAEGSLRTVAGVPEPAETSALGRLVDIDGLDPHGGAVRIGLAGGRGTTLLAFLTTGCGTCQRFWRAFGEDGLDRARVPGDARIVVVTKGEEAESPATVAELAPDQVTTVMSSDAWDAYAVPGSPYFVLVDGAHGVVGEGSAATWPQVVDLLAKAVADAGVDLDGRGRLSRRALLGGGQRDREARADRELAAAGIEPGSPELYLAPDDIDGGEAAPDEEPPS